MLLFPRPLHHPLEGGVNRHADRVQVRGADAEREEVVRRHRQPLIHLLRLPQQIHHNVQHVVDLRPPRIHLLLLPDLAVLHPARPALGVFPLSGNRLLAVVNLVVLDLVGLFLVEAVARRKLGRGRGPLAERLLQGREHSVHLAGLVLGGGGRVGGDDEGVCGCGLLGLLGGLVGLGLLLHRLLNLHLLLLKPLPPVHHKAAHKVRARARQLAHQPTPEDGGRRLLLHLVPQRLDHVPVLLAALDRSHHPSARRVPQVHPRVGHLVGPLVATRLLQHSKQHLPHDRDVVRLGAVLDVPGPEPVDLFNHPALIVDKRHEGADHLDKLHRHHGARARKHRLERRRKLKQSVKQHPTEVLLRVVVHTDVPALEHKRVVAPSSLEGKRHALGEPGPHPTPRLLHRLGELGSHGLGEDREENLAHDGHVGRLDTPVNVHGRERLELAVHPRRRVDDGDHGRKHVDKLDAHALPLEGEHGRQLGSLVKQRVVVQVAELKVAFDLEAPVPRRLDHRRVLGHVGVVPGGGLPLGHPALPAAHRAAHDAPAALARPRLGGALVSGALARPGTPHLGAHPRSAGA
mmetsp:Transcript_17734/g.42803  ORF Transcript_17734/g.42803 Transcript_17734/m.42803 type:complete len:575 (-) Transcript_17734:629-2353(-)